MSTESDFKFKLDNMTRLIMIKAQCFKCLETASLDDNLDNDIYYIGWYDYGWLACDKCKTEAKTALSSILNEVKCYDKIMKIRDEYKCVKVRRSNGIIESNWTLSTGDDIISVYYDKIKDIRYETIKVINADKNIVKNMNVSDFLELNKELIN